MPTNTANLNLFKYGSTDGARTFNIDEALNANWDKIDEAVAKKYTKAPTGIPELDLDSAVKAALGKARTALQSVTKADVGLGNVDNTSDASKPISTAQAEKFGEVEGALTTHKADNTHIFNIDVTYATNVYTVVNAPTFTDYLTVRFKAPNTIVDTATFKIGTDVYTMVNADFELNEIVIVTFDKAQKKVFFKRGGGENQTLPPQLTTFTVNPNGISGQLKLDWTISSTTYLDDFIFVYKTGSYPTSSRDGTQVTAVKTARTLTITGLTDNTTYYVRAYPRNAKKQLQTDYKVTSGMPIIADDVKMSPGPVVLAKGTMQEGYFGLVTSSELINGDSLASLVGLTAGTSQFSAVNWLKFAYKGKVLFVAQKPIRNNLSWDNINAVGAVTGTKQVAIKSLNYKVRLPQGALTNPSETNTTDRGAKGSEWNRLMLAVHEQVKNKNWAYPAYVESDIQDFGTYLTDADLITNSSSGNGSYSWCQETAKNDSSYRVVRGTLGVSSLYWSTSSTVTADSGWRPVLELV